MSDYIGKPIAAYNGVGNLVWDVEYDIYGNIRSQNKGSKDFIPFRNQGQYEDVEVNLFYNRYRYYSADSGMYISQDPIGLEGNNPNIYAYVSDTNIFVDLFGLLEIIRTMSSGEVSATESSKGLVRGPNNSRGAKWVSNGVDPYNTAKNSDHKVVFDMDSSTEDFLKKDNLDYEDMQAMGKTEKNVTNNILTKANEKGALGIGVDKLEEFNSKIKSITIFKKEKGKWKKKKTIKCKK